MTKVFEWDENLLINMRGAHVSECKKYIKDDKFACFDCGIDLNVEDEEKRLLIKKTRIKRADGAYLAICRECGEKEDF